MEKIKNWLQVNLKSVGSFFIVLLVGAAIGFLGGLYYASGRIDSSAQEQINTLTRLSTEQSRTMEALKSELRESKSRLERAARISEELEAGAKRGTSSAEEARGISADGLRNNQEAERILREIIQGSEKAKE